MLKVNETAYENASDQERAWHREAGKLVGGAGGSEGEPEVVRGWQSGQGPKQKLW